MSLVEKKLHLRGMALSYIEIAEKYNHSAIFVHPNPGGIENVVAILEEIRNLSGDKYFLMMHGDHTFSIPDGDGMWDFSAKMYEEPDELKEQDECKTIC